MTKTTFFHAVFQVAKELKNSELTIEEKEKIKYYFEHTSGSNYNRAREAIKNTIYKDIPESLLISPGPINHLKNKVKKLKQVAEEWKKK